MPTKVFASNRLNFPTLDHYIHTVPHFCPRPATYLSATPQKTLKRFGIHHRTSILLHVATSRFPLDLHIISPQTNFLSSPAHSHFNPTNNHQPIVLRPLHSSLPVTTPPQPLISFPLHFHHYLEATLLWTSILTFLRNPRINPTCLLNYKR